MKFPVRIRHRDAKAVIYGRTKAYPFYRAIWRRNGVGGKRVVRSFGKYSKALAAAEKAVRDIAKGVVPVLNNRQNGDAIAALERLEALRMESGKHFTLKAAVNQFADAAEKLEGVSLMEAVTGFLATAANVKRKEISKAIEEFLSGEEIRTKAKDGKRPQVSPKYFYNFAILLRKFSGAFPNTDVCALTKDHLDRYLASLSDRSPKSRNHHRMAVKRWLAWAVSKDFLAPTHRLLETPGMKPESTDGEDIAFYTPREFRMLLEGADGALQAILAVKGLAGLRTAEALRLDWADVWRVPGHIEVTARKSKTRARRLIPICSALEQWLAPWRKHKNGPLWPEDKGPERDWIFQQRVTLLHDQVGLPRKRNGLRHAFCTFHFALHGNENLTAAHAGHAPAMLHAHYRGLATKIEAEKWFAVQPATGNKIVALEVVS